jgi:DNA topoisomerase-1
VPDTARAAGLRYVSDAQPGIRRRRAGRGFSFVGPDGVPIKDREELKRIRALVIPPAWTDVWICAKPNGHLQATGRDARGRKQYRYHRRYREIRDETKFDRMLAFSKVLPKIRGRVERDLRREGLPREKVLATVVRLLEKTLIRIGSDVYARENRSYGLTTLKRRHVEVSGSRLHFEFRGKSGIMRSVAVTDRRAAKIVQHCQTLTGQELFQYLDDDGKRQDVGSGDINAYLREITGQEITAKDFRTWAGTIYAAVALRDMGPGSSERETNTNIVAAIDLVAKRLGNTRAVCRHYYVHPRVIEAYRAGRVAQALPTSSDGKRRRSRPGLRQDEITVLQLLHLENNNAKSGAKKRTPKPKESVQ